MKNVIKQYFDKSGFLTTKNKAYCEICLQLFDFQINNDLIKNDITSKIINGKCKDSKAYIVTKQSGIVCGIEEVVYLIEKKTNLKVKVISNDGTVIKEKDLLIELFGNPLEILKFERTILNIISRMSGIATLTNSLIKKNNLKTQLAATRKTLWGLMDKKAVFIGGGLTHRLSLSDEILIKDNHIDILAEKFKVSRFESLKMIFNHIKNSLVKNPFEIEVETEKEAYFLNNIYQKINITAPLIIMLDNFKPKIALKTIKTIKQQNNSKPIFFELSGGINENNIKEYDSVRADVLSIGALTHSAKALDISLQLMK
jgi:nicotinate-nucleotide pyrophosphorylase (carboxylating)